MSRYARTIRPTTGRASGGGARGAAEWRRRIPILHSVYAVGHRPRLLRGWHWAALLAAGERSGLAIRSAGAHWCMTKPPGRPHVIAPRSADGIKGIVVHRPRTLAEDDIVEDQGLRVASPARVLLDLAGEGADRRSSSAPSTRPRSTSCTSRSTPFSLDASAAGAREAAGPSSNGTRRVRPSPTARQKRPFWQSRGAQAFRTPFLNATSRANAGTSSGRTTESWWRSTAGGSTTRSPPSSATG